MRTSLPPLFFLLVVPRASHAQFSFDADYRASYTNKSSALRAHLLEGYDKAVPPYSRRVNYVDFSEAGTDVRVQIRFFKIESVDAANGQMRLKVWFRLHWQDLRLAWNPEEWGNITKTFFQGASVTNPEISEIWLPDVQPYNSAKGIDETLDKALVQVWSDGEVFWSRPGILDVLCRFSGLVAFPNDRVHCAIEIGGWALSGGYQGIELHNEGWVNAEQETTSGASYQEMKIHNVSVERAVFTYECCPSEPWPVLRYDITMERAQIYYILLIIYPSLLITFLSLSVFFMSPGLTERIGYATTLLLVNEVGKVTIAGLIPVCGELLWVEAFSSLCTIFCTIALVESSFVLLLYHHTEEHLIPSSWYFFFEVCSLGVALLLRRGRRGLLDKFWERKGRPKRPVRKSELQQSIKEVAMLEKEVEFESSAAVFYRRHMQSRSSASDVVDAVDLGRSPPPTLEAPPLPRPWPRPSSLLDSASMPPPIQKSPVGQDGLPTEHERHSPESLAHLAATAAGGAMSDRTKVLEACADAPLAAAPRAAAPYPAAPLAAASPPPSPPSGAPPLGAEPSAEDSLGGEESPTGRDRPPLHNPGHTDRHSQRFEEFVLGSAKRIQSRNTNLPALPASASIASSIGTGSEGVRRLMLIENAFFMLDTSSHGWIHLREVSRFLSFARLGTRRRDRTGDARALAAALSQLADRLEASADMGPYERQLALTLADKHGDGRFVRLEFLDVCTACLSETPCAEIELALRNFEHAQNMFKRRYTLKWQSLAITVDRWCRLIIPVFIACVIFLFNVNLDDYYREHLNVSNPEELVMMEMFTGLAPIWSINDLGWFAIALLPSIGVLIAICFFCERRFLARQDKEEPARLKEHMRERMARSFSADDDEVGSAMSVARERWRQQASLHKLFKTNPDGTVGWRHSQNNPDKAPRIPSVADGSEGQVEPKPEAGANAKAATPEEAKPPAPPKAGGPPAEDCV